MHLGPTLRPAAPIAFAARRRRRRRWTLPASVLVVGLILVGFRAGGAGTGEGQAAAEAATRAPQADVQPAASPPAEADVAATPMFARLDGLLLHLPSDDAVVLGFHEAATTSALELEPVGRLRTNRNTTRFDPPEDDPRGADYLVLSSRGRSAAATSAADIVTRDDDPVRSPVTGTVREVRSYFLYGRHADHRIELIPDDAPHLRLVLLHVDEVLVRAGDRVEAGVSPLAATANRFPFGSHIDRETGPDRWPHVHVEVHPIDAPRLGDPPAP